MAWRRSAATDTARTVDYACRCCGVASGSDGYAGFASRRTGTAAFGYNSDIAESIASMARWPRHVWTSIFTYATVFVLFPLLCLLAYAWVRGWIF